MKITILIYKIKTRSYEFGVKARLGIFFNFTILNDIHMIMNVLFLLFESSVALSRQFTISRIFGLSVFVLLWIFPLNVLIIGFGYDSCSHIV